MGADARTTAPEHKFADEDEIAEASARCFVANDGRGAVAVDTSAPSQLHGFHFRKQCPIGPYIADFACLEANLIIEVDSGQHSDNATNAARDAWFTTHGYRHAALLEHRCPAAGGWCVDQDHRGLGPIGTPENAQAHRHQIDPDHRRRADRDRAGLRVRLFRRAGVQGAEAEGYRIVLVNSNPATIMTDPELADATYIEPITPDDRRAHHRARSRPDALLPTMGGQTALNTAMALPRSGALKELGVELIGANEEAIAKAEDRQLFRLAMDRIGLESPKGRLVSTLDAAIEALVEVGLPAIIRPSFTLGGTGGGIAYNTEEFDGSSGAGCGLAGRRGAGRGIGARLEGVRARSRARPQRQLHHHLLDREHRPDGRAYRRFGITVAPALTLTDKEYQLMRNAAIAVLREIGVDTGGSRTCSSRSIRRRAARHHRDEPARVALVGAGLEGDRLPDRQGRRQARGRLHARRDSTTRSPA